MLFKARQNQTRREGDLRDWEETECNLQCFARVVMIVAVEVLVTHKCIPSCLNEFNRPSNPLFAELNQLSPYLAWTLILTDALANERMRQLGDGVSIITDAFYLPNLSLVWMNLINNYFRLIHADCLKLNCDKIGKNKPNKKFCVLAIDFDKRFEQHS